MRALINSKTVRYIFSGGTAAVVNLTTTWCLERVGLPYLLVATIAFSTALVVSFTLQKFVTFRDADSGGTHKQFMIFTATGLINLFVNDVLVFIQIDILTVRSLVVAQAISSILIALYSFFVYQKLIFKKPATGRHLRVLYLFNKIITKTLEAARQGTGHDSWCFGMMRLPKYGVETDYLEIEQFVPAGLSRFLRKHVLTMHYAHLPLFPLFFRYDIVFSSTAYSSLIVKALLHVKRFKWVILDFNVLGTIREGKTIKQRIYAWAVSKADGVVCISEAARDAMRKKFPHLADRIIFLHEATDPAYFKPAHGDPDSTDVIRQGIDNRTVTSGAKTAERPVILSVGNYGRDFSTVISATEGLNVECRLATKVASPEAYRHMAIDMPARLPPHVSVNTYTHAEMLSAYEKAAIVVVGITEPDAYFDSVGTFALGEALSMAKPVIVTHTKSMESYVRDGENGLFVPHKDAAALRAKISEVLKRPNYGSLLGREGRRFAIEFLDPERFARGLADFFKDVGSRRKRQTDDEIAKNERYR